MGKLNGKVAIITGGASGIGKATARLFADEEASVVVADVDEQGGRAVAEEISSASRTATFVRVDVSKAEDVEAMVQTAVDTYGRLDVLFNNAGIEGELAPIADCTLENWDRVMGINLKGVFLGIKYAIPAILKSGGGSIINTASVDSIVATRNAAAYCASKGGVLQLTKAAALDYGRQGIRVNAICPGGIWTPLLERWGAGLDPETLRKGVAAAEPIGRCGQPEEVAHMALFLASDDSSFCTGAPFLVDGGFVAV